MPLWSFFPTISDLAREGRLGSGRRYDLLGSIPGDQCAANNSASQPVTQKQKFFADLRRQVRAAPQQRSQENALANEYIHIFSRIGKKTILYLRHVLVCESLVTPDVSTTVAPRRW